MRWAVEYTLATGTIGLMIFTAQDIEEAEQYVTDMITKYGHTHVYNLSPLTDGAGIDELYRLFPRIARIDNKDNIPSSSMLG
jgi:hypothetical protein